MSNSNGLNPHQRSAIEERKKKAMNLRKLKSQAISKAHVVSSCNKNIVCIEGTKFIDTDGGFLLEDNSGVEDEQKIVPEIEPLLDCDQPICLECNIGFATSYLLQTFDHSVCDGCRDSEDKHCLITKTEAKNEYLLKDCDLDLREPPLKFILRQNPHNATWGQMKLYLLVQVEKRALEVWGSMEKLKEAHIARKEKRLLAKSKQYNKNLKVLRMTVRSSLFDHRVNAATHEHQFGEELYNPEEDNYKRSCKTCGFQEFFEKM